MTQVFVNKDIATVVDDIHTHDRVTYDTGFYRHYLTINKLERAIDLLAWVGVEETAFNGPRVVVVWFLDPNGGEVMGVVVVVHPGTERNRWIPNTTQCTIDVSKKSRSDFVVHIINYNMKDKCQNDEIDCDFHIIVYNMNNKI